MEINVWIFYYSKSFLMMKMSYRIVVFNSEGFIYFLDTGFTPSAQVSSQKFIIFSEYILSVEHSRNELLIHSSLT